MKPRGLVLVTGVTGSGKSTTLAAMIEHINETQAREHHHDRGPDRVPAPRQEVVASTSARWALDTGSFDEALRHMLRQDPDVIMIGEIRDPETIEIALKAADTGHLVFSTLHTIDATQTINRIISFFPPHQHEEIRFIARERAPGGHLAAPRPALRQRGARAGVRDPDRHRRRCATTSATCREVAASPTLIKEGTVAVRDADLRPVDHAAATPKKMIRIETARCSTPATRANSRCACRVMRGVQRRRRGTTFDATAPEPRWAGRPRCSRRS